MLHYTFFFIIALLPQLLVWGAEGEWESDIYHKINNGEKQNKTPRGYKENTDALCGFKQSSPRGKKKNKVYKMILNLSVLSHLNT